MRGLGENTCSNDSKTIPNKLFLRPLVPLKTHRSAAPEKPWIRQLD